MQHRFWGYECLAPRHPQDLHYASTLISFYDILSPSSFSSYSNAFFFLFSTSFAKSGLKNIILRSPDHNGGRFIVCRILFLNNCIWSSYLFIFYAFEMVFFFFLLCLLSKFIRFRIVVSVAGLMALEFFRLSYFVENRFRVVCLNIYYHRSCKS